MTRQAGALQARDADGTIAHASSSPDEQHAVHVHGPRNVTDLAVDLGGAFAIRYVRVPGRACLN